MLLALCLLGASLQPPPAATPAVKPFVGPPSPYRLQGAETIWVLGRYLPELKGVQARKSLTGLGLFGEKLKAKEILPARLSLDPLDFLPVQRYGGNPHPKSYPLGSAVTFWAP